MADLKEFLAEVCPECGTPGPQRHLSAVGGCQTCCRDDPRPVHIYPVYRNVFPRWHSGKLCYWLPSGNVVHVKPDCRCP